MANTTNLTINNLDFDTIKSSLKGYLQGQTAFADYNFEGSGINILLDVLAYNTHYEAFYNNMIANEMFLDSAVDRSNVVSIAKTLGYTPLSYRAASATVDLSLGSTVGYSAGDYLPRGEVFSTTKDGVSYSFVTTSATLINLAPDDGYHFKDIPLKEGKVSSFSFVYDSRQPDKKIIIPEPTIDTSTLTVRVQNSVTDSTGYSDSWSLATDFNDLDSDTKAYFLQEVEEGRFEIYFGDGVLGKSLEEGNLVILNYIVTSGDSANGIGNLDSSTSRTFTYGSGNTVVVTSPSSGGSNREDIESIRFKAPLSYQSQNRAVTIRDYRSIIQREYPDIESVSIWGGEDNDPPEFGSVIIAFKPSSGLIITDSRKRAIRDSLIQEKNIIGVNLSIVDPDYTFLRITSEVNYDPDTSSLSAQSLKTAVTDRIVAYIDENLDKFDKGLRFSKLLKEIDGVDDSILSNETEIVLEKRYTPTSESNQSFLMDFGNPLFHPHSGHASVITSTRFRFTNAAGVSKEGFVEDDGNGRIRLVSVVGGDRIIEKTSSGTVDYESGIVNVSGITITESLDFPEVRLRAEPGTQDISSNKRIILTLDNEDSSSLSVTAVSQGYGRNPGGRSSGSSTSGGSSTSSGSGGY